MQEKYNWEDIKTILQTDLNEIFNGTDITDMSDYEKRKMIFDHLVEKITYDYDKLNDIYKFKSGLIEKINRNLQKELIDTIINKKGICNSISQYYKLLLEQVGITSYCVVCDDGTEINHQLNIVLDNQTGNFSFDDITSVIVNRGSKDEFFNYDLEDANRHNQGLRNTEIGKKWQAIPNELIYYYVGKQSDNKELLEFPINKISKITTRKIK